MRLHRSPIIVPMVFAALMLLDGVNLGTGPVLQAQTVTPADTAVTVNSDRHHLIATIPLPPQAAAPPVLRWSQTAGPAGATISHPTAAVTPVVGLDKGVYTFRLTVALAGGVTNSQDVVLIVPAPQARDNVDDFVTAAMEKAKVKGLSLAIINHGKIVKLKGYGFTGADRETPVTPLTLFQAASMSKTVTALGALRLAEDKHISLDDDINKTLTSWKVPENEFNRNQKVTLRRLMAHMGGINVDGFFGYPRGEPIPSLLDVLDGKPPASSAPIRVGAVPGTRTAYSGSGYTIIQQWVADVSGQRFETYMRDALFDWLGMANSTFECPLPAAKWDLAAHGYGYAMPNGKSFPRAEMPWKWNHYPEMAAAGLWTTAGDLAAFVIDIQDTHAGRSNKVLSREGVDLMLTPVQGQQWKMGLGLVLANPGAPNAVFRFSGTNCGFQGGAFGTAETGQGCVVMYNDRAGEQFPEDIRQFVAKTYAWPK